MMEPVTGLLKTVAIMLLALWMPATMHCKLEAVTGNGLLACASDHHSGQHEADCGLDGCNVVETGSYKISSNPPFKFIPVYGAATMQVLLDELFSSFLPVSGIAPPVPEWSTTWQFLSRAAGLIRAPSRCL